MDYQKTVTIQVTVTMDPEYVDRLTELVYNFVRDRLKVAGDIVEGVNVIYQEEN